MRLPLRVLIILLSIGWLVPLCLSFAATYDFLHDIVWPAAAFGQPSPWPWHLFEWADELFYFAMGWLALVVIGWCIFLTRQGRSTSTDDD